MTTISIELTKAAATLANALIASNTKQGYSDYIATRNALLAITTSEDFHRIEDASKGIIDCKQGTYDKFFRYNRNDDGSAYDAGWQYQNTTPQNDSVNFIG